MIIRPDFRRTGTLLRPYIVISAAPGELLAVPYVLSVPPAFAGYIPDS